MAAKARISCFIYELFREEGGGVYTVCLKFAHYPSEKVGIMPGDRIISANDTVIAGKKMVNSQIIKVLRGPKGSVVDLKVKRGPELIDFTLTRDDIPVYSVDETFMADPSPSRPVWNMPNVGRESLAWP